MGTIATIEWKNGNARIVDQTELPHKLVFLNIKDVESMRRAIRKLKIRGAPAIGVAGAFGVVLGIKNVTAANYKEFNVRLNSIIRYLASSRPTAANLFWALDRMKRCAEENAGRPLPQIKNILLKEAFKMMEEDRDVCRRMASFGAKLLKNGDCVLTHCNAGGLATVDYGTALGVLFRAKEEGKKIKVFVGETRPLLQGARLSTWELLRARIDVTLICDNMAASLMQKGMIHKVIVGADRIARNGDAANKIGTYNLAVLASVHKIPFYIVAPFSTFDFKLSSGDKIPIEERDGSEVRAILGKTAAPRNVKVYNPAFDVTPAKFIDAIVTEKGIFRPPYVFHVKNSKKGKSSKKGKRGHFPIPRSGFSESVPSR